MKKAFSLLLSLILLAGLLMVSPRPALAQGGSAYELIDAVNQLRAANGLTPYEIDASLMAFAQAHSDYAASNLSCANFTHIRADGTRPRDYGITENIACGTNMEISGIWPYWADYDHQNTMLGYKDGYVGAGVAVSGSTVFYTLDVRQGAGGKVNPVVNPTASNGTPAPTLPLIAAITTNTPGADGSIIHIVGEGQSLVNIALAYGLSMTEIRTLNNIPLNYNLIRPGDKLVVRAAFTATPTPTITLTPTKTPRPSHTPSPTRPTRTPVPTRTLTRTPAPPTPTPAPLLPFLPANISNRQIAGGALILICAVGLLVLGLTGFRGPKKPPSA
ncbi:MAG TPA: LysM peptidoglycan-binding domain-containing protein [Anaerolineaceae bacterium]|nr:LysM peptidoglycan-binding domain-containing protein [Anaerolineaceae bacterium]HPN51828.1 LysM peptidoglycan-binding domain-containing protein [Anaerolineaceae bacterium]